MKMYNAPPEDHNLVVIPSGTQFPRHPKVGTIFRLTQDMPITHTVDRWYGIGTYVYDYGAWVRINDSGRQRKSDPIAPQLASFEERPHKQTELPNPDGGILLASLQMIPVSRLSQYSGTASFWVDPVFDCTITAAVFRDTTKLIGMAVETLQRGKLRTVSLSFMDIPFSGAQLGEGLSATYSLRLYSDTLGSISLNKGAERYQYDEVAPLSAFIVSENT